MFSHYAIKFLTLSSHFEKEANEAKRFGPESLACHGCCLLSNFARFHLKEQMRSAKDDKHKSFVMDLSHGNTITVKRILQFKNLSEKDMQDSPDEWKHVPVLVSTNQERLRIARFKAQMWAKEHKTYVFKWPVLERQHVNRPELSSMKDIRDQHAFFWQLFVPGADSCLNTNVNPDLSMVNGSPLVSHSLTFDDPKEYRQLVRHLETQDVPHGSETEVVEPIATNFIVKEQLDDKPISSKRSLQLQQLREISQAYNLDPTSDDIIMPITTSMNKTDASNYNDYHCITDNLLSPVSSVKTCEPFPFELAFSMTVHKAQGRTIPRVVVDLTHQGSPQIHQWFSPS